MNDNRYRWILYAIIIVIIATISIQMYWNYKNYLNSKQQLINEVQISLDRAVDDYYTTLAKNTTVGFAFQGKLNDSINTNTFETVFKSRIDDANKVFRNLDSIENNSSIKIFRGKAVDSLLQNQLQSDLAQADSLRLNHINDLTTKVVVSISNDTLDIFDISKRIGEEFKRKKLNIDPQLFYFKDSVSLNIFENSKTDSKHPNKKVHNPNVLSTLSKSSFLPKGSILKLYFSNEKMVILNRIFGSILLSTLLILAVILCLFYLLNIIKHQKQLAEVKNDLISNITHEFKTPIATIGVALESINSFDVINDKAKTKEYITMSSNQLEKLNVMVEKLLETATLDSDNLILQKEIINLFELLTVLTNRYQTQYPNKAINSMLVKEDIIVKADPFHFENALNNLLDNAIKYGGDKITVSTKTENQYCIITISDNGNTISKEDKTRVFEKFYRIPKGNTHNVKGFGIGLYYTKTIIDKHNGTIQLNLSNDLTTFKIKFPNV